MRSALGGHRLDGRTLTIRTGIADVVGRLVETDTKSHRPRTISIDAGTARLLRAHHQRAARIAADHGTALAARAFVLSEAPDGSAPYLPAKATGTFRRVARRAGLPAARLHDLRYFAATRMLTAGIDVRTVAGRLGHVNRGPPSTPTPCSSPNGTARPPTISLHCSTARDRCDTK